MMKQFDLLLNIIIKNRKNHFWIFLLIMLVLSASMLYLYNPIKDYPGWDYYFHIMRFEALINALKDGTFPSYIDYNATTGYGYLCKTFYPDPILIPFAAVGLFTGSYIAYQVMIFTLTVLCGIFTYSAVNKIYKSTYVAALAGILYSFSLYRLYDLFHRAALGEALSFTFVPLVILGLYHIIKGDYKKKWYVLSIGFSLIIFSHVISSVLMFITTIIILIFYIKPIVKEPKRILYLILSAFVSLLVVSYFIFPILEQILSNTFYYKTKPVFKPNQALFDIKNIIKGLLLGLFYAKNLSFVGTGFILSLLVSMRIFIKNKSTWLRSVDIGVIIGIFYIFCISTFFPWHIYPFTDMDFIQFPWRLYEYTTYFFSIAGAYYLSLIFNSNRNKFLAGVSIICITTLIMYTHSNNYRFTQSVNIPKSWITPNIHNNFYLFGAEYVPSKVPSIEYIAKRGSDSIATNYDNTAISNFSRNRGKTSFDIKLNNKQEVIELPLFYYKGYTATINSKPIAVEESKNGLVQIPVEQSGRVEAYYGGTTVQKVSYYITMISSILLGVYIFSKRRYNNRFSKKPKNETN